MKISCDVIRDLLPIYSDGVCSEDSKKVVEEHISLCKECSDCLKKMKEDFCFESCIGENIKDAKVMKNISNQWRKDKIFSLLKGGAITLLILLILYCFVGIDIVKK